MLPEQFNRIFETLKNDNHSLRFETFEHSLSTAEILNNVRQVRRFQQYLRWAILHPFYMKYPCYGWPETLTGDEWRAAWANAHDPETQKALDAIYR